ncbi:MAG: nitrilase-related carbon-nitrogen hydrolase, partial [Acidobacteriota bacterium]
MRIAVCEAHPEMLPGSKEWRDLAARVRAGAPDLFLLNEMPFGPWISAGERPDPAVVEESHRLHRRGMESLAELGVPVVLGTRSSGRDGLNVNEAFVWTRADGSSGVHTKQYFPDESGYYEARWFQAREKHFRVVDAAGLRVGFLICTEVMFNEHAR